MKRKKGGGKRKKDEREKLFNLMNELNNEETSDQRYYISVQLFDAIIGSFVTKGIKTEEQCCIQRVERREDLHCSCLRDLKRSRRNLIDKSSFKNSVYK